MWLNVITLIHVISDYNSKSDNSNILFIYRSVKQIGPMKYNNQEVKIIMMVLLHVPLLRAPVGLMRLG
jgi:hypothetical protein